MSNGEAGPNNFNRWLQQSCMGSDTSDPPLFRPLEEHRHDQHHTSSVNLISENINETIETINIKDMKAGY